MVIPRDDAERAVDGAERAVYMISDHAPGDLDGLPRPLCHDPPRRHGVLSRDHDPRPRGRVRRRADVLLCADYIDFGVPKGGSLSPDVLRAHAAEVGALTARSIRATVNGATAPLEVEGVGPPARRASRAGALPRAARREVGRTDPRALDRLRALPRARPGAPGVRAHPARLRRDLVRVRARDPVPVAGLGRRRLARSRRPARGSRSSSTGSSTSSRGSTTSCSSSGS